MLRQEVTETEILRTITGVTVVSILAVSTIATTAGAFESAVTRIVEWMLTIVLSALMGLSGWLFSFGTQAFLVFPVPSAIDQLGEAWFVFAGLYFALMPIAGVAFYSSSMLFPNDEKANPYRFVERLLISAIAVVLSSPVFAAQTEGIFPGSNEIDIISLVVYVVHGIVNVIFPDQYTIGFLDQGLNSFVTALAAGTASGISILGFNIIMSLFLVAVLLTVLVFYLLLALRMLLIYFFYAAFPTLMAFWVLDLGPGKYANMFASIVFKLTSFLLLSGILIAVIMASSGAISGGLGIDGFAQEAENDANAVYESLGNISNENNWDLNGDVNPDEINVTIDPTSDLLNDGNVTAGSRVTEGQFTRNATEKYVYELQAADEQNDTPGDYIVTQSHSGEVKNMSVTAQFGDIALYVFELELSTGQTPRFLGAKRVFSPNRGEAVTSGGGGSGSVVNPGPAQPISPSLSEPSTDWVASSATVDAALAPSAPTTRVVFIQVFAWWGGILASMGITTSAFGVLLSIRGLNKGMQIQQQAQQQYSRLKQLRAAGGLGGDADDSDPSDGGEESAAETTATSDNINPDDPETGSTDTQTDRQRATGGGTSSFTSSSTTADDTDSSSSTKYSTNTSSGSGSANTDTTGGPDTGDTSQANTDSGSTATSDGSNGDTGTTDESETGDTKTADTTQGSTDENATTTTDTGAETTESDSPESVDDIDPVTLTQKLGYGFGKAEQAVEEKTGYDISGAVDSGLNAVDNANKHTSNVAGALRAPVESAADATMSYGQQLERSQADVNDRVTERLENSSVPASVASLGGKTAGLATGASGKAVQAAGQAGYATIAAGSASITGAKTAYRMGKADSPAESIYELEQVLSEAAHARQQDTSERSPDDHTGGGNSGGGGSGGNGSGSSGSGGGGSGGPNGGGGETTSGNSNDSDDSTTGTNSDTDTQTYDDFEAENVNYCPECGTERPDFASYCPNCGERYAEHTNDSQQGSTPDESVDTGKSEPVDDDFDDRSAVSSDPTPNEPVDTSKNLRRSDMNESVDDDQFNYNAINNFDITADKNSHLVPDTARPYQTGRGGWIKPSTHGRSPVQSAGELPHQGVKMHVSAPEGKEKQASAAISDALDGYYEENDHVPHHKFADPRENAQYDHLGKDKERQQGKFFTVYPTMKSELRDNLNEAYNDDQALIEKHQQALRDLGNDNLPSELEPDNVKNPVDKELANDLAERIHTAYEEHPQLSHQNAPTIGKEDDSNGEVRLGSSAVHARYARNTGNPISPETGKEKRKYRQISELAFDPEFVDKPY